MTADTLELAKQWASIVRDLTLSGVLVYILRGGAKKVWVWGWQLEAAEKREAATAAACELRVAAAERRENEWKDLLLETRYVARTAVDIVAKRKRDG